MWMEVAELYRIHLETEYSRTEQTLTLVDVVVSVPKHYIMSAYEGCSLSSRHIWKVSFTPTRKATRIHWIDQGLGPLLKVSLALLFIEPKFPGI